MTPIQWVVVIVITVTFAGLPEWAAERIRRWHTARWYKGSS